MNRIAPLDGFPIHFDASLYLNSLSTQWKLRDMGEPHALTPEMLAEWKDYRDKVAVCNFQIFNITLRYSDAFKQLKHGAHQEAIEFIDELIAKLEKEYEWPKPSNPIVTAQDIERLRLCINELDQCRESLIKY